MSKNKDSFEESRRVWKGVGFIKYKGGINEIYKSSKWNYMKWKNQLSFIRTTLSITLLK